MIRIVTDFVDRPGVLFICDNTKCGCTASGALHPDVDMAQQLQTATQNLIKEGWSIGIMGAICPGHTKQAVQQAMEETKLVQPVSLYSASGRPQ